jgi:hypothetical protein
MTKLLYAFLIFSLCFADTNLQKLDSLYKSREFSAFLDASTNLLEKKPELKNDFEFLLKLANASYQTERYSLARQIYGIAATKDSILNDYVRYFHSLASLQLADTIAFYENTEKFYKRDSKSYLAQDLLRTAVNLTSEKNDTLHFLRFAKLYSKKKRLKAATAFKRLNLLQKVSNDSTVLEEQVAFLKSYANSRFAEVIIDSIYNRIKLNSLSDEELFYLTRAAVQNDYKQDSLILHYHRIKNLDQSNEIMLDYLLTEKKQSAAIEFIKKEKTNGKVSQKLARSLPRLLNKKNKTKEAYEHYLDYARHYPNHPFALNAVTFVLGRTEKKDRSFYLKALREFTENPSKYRQYYRFRHVLHYYERKDFKTSMSLINRYLKGDLSNYHKMRLLFWKSKLHFELNDRPKGFALLEELAKDPFNSYYNMKS